MEKNTVIAIVLSTLVIIGWMFLNTKLSQRQNTASQAETTLAEEPASTAVPATRNLGIAVADDEIEAEENQYVIQTNKVRVTFTNKGGDIISYELLDQIDTETNRAIEMADNVTAQNRAFAVSFGAHTNPINSDIYKTSVTEDRKSIRFAKDYTIKDIRGTDSLVTVTKTYRFLDDDYMFKLDIDVSGTNPSLNFDGIAYSLHSTPQVGPKYDPKNRRYEYRTFVSESNNKRKMKNINDNRTDFFEKEYTWTGVTGKYFAALVVPENAAVMGRTVYSTAVENGAYPNAQVTLTRTAITSAAIDSYYIYVGPRNEQELSKYNKTDSNAWKQYNLKLTDALQTSGILSWLEIALKFIMECVHKFIPPHNWGIAIIITTIIIKLILFPLTRKSSLSTIRMQELQPQMTALQEKYRDNPQKLNMEMAAFYKEAGYNPLSGCLPMLIQLPILIAMYNLFNNYFEFRGAMFIPGWITDLSKGDTVFSLQNGIPFLGWTELRLLPVIYVISQLLFGKITNNGGATTGQTGTQMKLMMYLMPVMFFFIFYNAPSGLLLYWTVSNVFTLIQQIAINRMVARAKKDIVVKNKNVVRFPKGKKTTR